MVLSFKEKNKKTLTKKKNNRFMDDEKKNFAPNLNKPITKAEVEAIKQKVRELDAMPIKKVIEARARNKKKVNFNLLLLLLLLSLFFFLVHRCNARWSA